MPEQLHPRRPTAEQAHSSRVIDAAKVGVLLGEEIGQGATSEHIQDYVRNHPRWHRTQRRLLQQISRLVAEGNPRTVAGYLSLPELQEEVGPEQQVEYMRSAYQKVIDTITPKAGPVILPESAEDYDHILDKDTQRIQANRQLEVAKQRLIRWTEDVYTDDEQLDHQSSKRTEEEFNAEQIKTAAAELVDLYLGDNLRIALGTLNIREELKRRQTPENWGKFAQKYPQFNSTILTFQANMLEARAALEEYPHVISSLLESHFREVNDDVARMLLKDILVSRHLKSTKAIDYDVNYTEDAQHMLEDLGVANDPSGLTAQAVAEAVLTGRLMFNAFQLTEIS